MLTRGWPLLLLGLAGCFASPSSSDLLRVRELSGGAAIAEVTAAYDPGPSEEVRAIVAEPLDADAAVRVALLNNRELRARLRELGVARGLRVQAGLLPNPVLEVEAIPERDSELELRVEYDLTALLLAPRRSDVAEAELEAERYRVAKAVVRLRFDVQAAFYALQASEQRLGIARRALDAAAAGRDAARALHEAGNVPALDLRVQEAAYERERLAVAEIEIEAADRRESLQRLLGLHGTETGWRTSGALRPAPRRLAALDRYETRAVEASLELREARSRLEALARRLRLSRTEGTLPGVALDVHTLVGDPDRGANRASSAGWAVSGGASFTLPIFDRKQGLIVAQRAELDALRERTAGAAIEVRSAARDARNRLRSAHARARHLQEVALPAQRRVTEETLLQYNAMQLGVFRLLQARRAQLELELVYAETLRELWTAQAAHEALLAGARVGSPAPSPSRREADEAQGGH